MTVAIGQGYDAHRFSEEIGDFSVTLAGVPIPHDRFIVAHSDGDVLIHAFCDALLGALALGDIGQHFPDSDPAYADIDSRELLAEVYQLVNDNGFALSNGDMTVMAETPRLAPHIVVMRESLADVIGVLPGKISIKATTTEGMGFVGRKEGIAVLAIVLLESLK
jgi:2-C-methyl-D-erythritol 2,4-cyclodiphosphate synthase